MTPNPHQHPGHHLRWDGDRRAAIIGLPQAGGTTIAIHLLRALTRLAVPAVGLDQTQPHTFATAWGHARRAITGHGHWPQVRQLRNADHMASIRHQVVVVDVGHSDDLRRRCAALATVIVMTVGNRNVTGSDTDRAAIDEFANLAAQFPTHVPRLLVASHIDGHESAIAPATLADIAGRLGAQTTLPIPHYDLLPAAVAHGDDIWSYRRDQPPTADLAACRDAMRQPNRAAKSKQNPRPAMGHSPTRPRTSRLLISPRRTGKSTSRNQQICGQIDGQIMPENGHPARAGQQRFSASARP